VPASEESVVEELPECPDHHPSSFLKGKPWCMLTPLLYTYHLSTLLVYCIKLELSENTYCIISILVQISNLNPNYSLGTCDCLAMLSAVEVE
jgi:hypothetical protein